MYSRGIHSRRMYSFRIQSRVTMMPIFCEASRKPVQIKNLCYNVQMSDQVPLGSSATITSTVWVVTEATLAEPLVSDH